MRLIHRSTVGVCLRGTPVLSEKPLHSIRSSRTFPVVVAGRPRKSAFVQNQGDGDPDERVKEIRELQKRINNEYGKGTLMVLSDAPEKLQVHVRFPTGLLSLDMILGGGLPKGRIFEVYGREGSGKTTLAMHLMSAAQKPDNYVYYVDTENAINPEYARKAGLDWDRAMLTQTGDGDQAFSIILDIMRSRVVDAICVDSVAGLVPPGEAEADFGDITIAGLARMMSKAMKNVSNANSGVGEEDRVTMVFVNQIRENPGIHYGNPITRPGGHALKFASFITMEVKAGKAIQDTEGNRIGHKMVIKLDKSKSARPFQTVELDLYYGEGLCKSSSLLDAAVSMDVVAQSGAYYKYEGETLGQGKAKAVDRLKEDETLAKKLEEATLLAFEEKGLDVAYYNDNRNEDSNSSIVSDDSETRNDPEILAGVKTMDDAPAPVEEGLISM